MSAAKKEETKIRQVAPQIKPHEERRILHQIPMPWYLDSTQEKDGQPKLTDSGTNVSFLLGFATLTHAEASKLYLDAVDREKNAGMVRKFWATVLANWETLTESAE